MTHNESVKLTNVMNEIGGPTNTVLSALKDKFPEIGWRRNVGLIEIDPKFKAPSEAAERVDDGGPAFPCYHEDTGEIAEGMSVRMCLAGQAMNGMMAAGNLGDRLVDLSFKFADDMIAKSQKP